MSKRTDRDAVADIVQQGYVASAGATPATESTTDMSTASKAASRAMPAPAERVAHAECVPCQAYQGSSFAEVWRLVTSDPYTELPTARVTLRSFFRGLRYRLLESGRRTISRRDDLLPHFDKLIRPNGICLAGTWDIHQSTAYTGLFASGARGRIIARASVALTETKAGHKRSFGLAGKVYPTLDADRRVKTANFFVIDDNGGTDTRHFLDARMTNQPTFSVNRSSLAALPVLVAITIAQRLSDSHSGTRQLYPLAAAGLDDCAVVSSPRFLMIRGARGARVAAADFRDELRLSLRSGPVELEICVRDDERTPWRPIGMIRATECVASESCDHRLHFSHPTWKDEHP